MNAVVLHTAVDVVQAVGELHGTVGVDTETSGLDWWVEDFTVNSVQVGDEHVVYCWSPAEVGELPTDLFTGKRLVAHNAAFDAMVLQRAGFKTQISQWECTAVTARLLMPAMSSHSLVECLRLEGAPARLVDLKNIPAIKARELGVSLSAVWESFTLDDELWLQYASGDVEAALYLWRSFDCRFLDRSLYRAEVALAFLMAEVQGQGMRVDPRYVEDLRSHYLEQQQAWEAVLYDGWGVESANSVDDLVGAFELEKIEIPEKSKSGKPKVDKHFLATLEHPLADAIVAAKGYRKAASTWLEHIRGVETVHPSIRTLAARTGRMSVTGIPAQCLPSSDWRIRRAFIPREGHAIWSFDYTAQELGVLAGLSGDESMLRAFREGLDLHQMTADASGVDRKLGKITNFATVYGGGAAVVAKQAGVDLGVARKAQEGFAKAFPVAAEFLDEVAAQAAEQGFITSPSGRFLPVDTGKWYAAKNFLIQSTARDITASALLKLAQHGLLRYILLPIHDEILMELPLGEEGDLLAAQVERLMSVDFIGCPIRAEGECYGRSWGGGYVDADNPADMREYNTSFEEVK